MRILKEQVIEMTAQGRNKILKIVSGVFAALIVLAAGFAAGLYFYGSHLYDSGYQKWESEVAAIENRYDGSYPQGGIVFYGSSSIRLWDSMKEDLSPLEVYNHGFGGSTLDDAIVYADRLVFPFNPKAVVIYSGTNDMGFDIPGYGKDEKEAYLMSVSLIAYIHEELPDTDVYYIASTPNKYRWSLWPRMDACNKMMEKWCTSHSKTYYIDTMPVLLNSNGEYIDELFQNDHLHFNEKGYEAWTSVIKPILMKKYG